MGLITRALLRPTQKAHVTSPKNIPPGSQMTVAWQYGGKVGKANVELYRNWARHDPWVRAAIDLRRRQVSSAEWAIVPFDKTKPFSPRLQKRVLELFNTPNPRSDSFRSFIEPIIEDILVLDAGVVEKDRNLLGELMNLWTVDAATIRVSATWDGSDPNESRYFWYPGYEQAAAILSRNMVYMMSNPVTYLPVGVSCLETLKDTIETELLAMDYNRRQVGGAAPDGLFDLGEDATPNDVRAYASHFMSEIAGKGAVGFIGGTKGAKFIPVRATNRDMQFLEWETFLIRAITAVFGMSPQDLGLTMDVNRANAEVQQQNTEDRGLRPLMALIQDYLTQEIVWDESFGGSDNNLAFRFISLNLKESLARAQMAKLSGAGAAWQSQNEIRMGMGYAPLGSPTDPDNPANKLIMVTPQGAATLDDVPSVRELIELLHSGAPPAAPEPPASPEKPKEDASATKALIEALNASVAANATRSSETDVLSRFGDMVRSMNERPINVSAPTTISEGAVQVSVATPPITVEPPNLTVEAPQITVEPPPARNVIRETSFEMDERGVITRKIETERDGD